MPRYIDADKLMQDIRQRAYLTDNIVERPIYAMTVLGIQQTVDEQPTISPDEARRVGKWIKNRDKVVWWFECSCCHEKPLIARFGDFESLSTFCPHCGALMMEVSENA